MQNKFFRLPDTYQQIADSRIVFFLKAAYIQLLAFFFFSLKTKQFINDNVYLERSS